jgi:hypothetical protein
MKRLTLVLVTAIGVAAFATSPASAATKCDGGGWTGTRSGYEVFFDRYRALTPADAPGAVQKTMNCASVRYAMGFVRRKVSRQNGWPHVTRPFFDGYVTWHCYKSYGMGRNVECLEGTSLTGFRFRAHVY